MESRLLEYGIRWRYIGEDEFDWDDVVAVINTEPAWGPINRAILANDWAWALPGYNELVLLSELLSVGNVQRGNQSGAKRSDFPDRVRRPWDNREVVDERKIGGKNAVDAQVMSQMLLDRMSDGERNQVLIDFANLI